MKTMKLLAGGFSALIGISASAQSLYWTTTGTSAPPDSPDSSLNFLNTVDAEGDNLSTVLTSDAYSHVIRNDPFNATTGNITGIAIDTVNQNIYFTDRNERSIRRSSIDGSDIELVLDPGLNSRQGPCGFRTSSPQGIAVDPENEYVYWSDPGYPETPGSLTSGAILRAKFDGSGLEVIVSNNGVSEGIALDLENNKIYFGSSVNVMGDDGCVNDGYFVQRANLDGSELEIIAEERARAVAVSSSEQAVYWTDQVNNVLIKANLDGSNREVLLNTGSGLFGVAVDNSSVYWSEDGTGNILRANLDGTQSEVFVSTDGVFPPPQFVTVINEDEVRMCNGQDATIIGTAGNDTLIGTSGNDVIVALGGNDTVSGLGGKDVICGGGGNDTLLGRGGADVLIGGGGNDTLKGGNGKDVLRGGAGNDTLEGGKRDDVLRGGNGNDTCNGSDGSDTEKHCEHSVDTEVVM
ncbi:MAG: DUF5050 domain-containing protein [Pseudomonadota bacterium]